MTKSQAKDLFQLQTELVDMKVDMTVSKSIERVIDQITDLKTDMNKRFSHLEKRFTSVEHRVIALESTLGKMSTTQNEIRTKFIDYSFKAGWIFLVGIASFVAVQCHSLIQALLKQPSCAHPLGNFLKQVSSSSEKLLYLQKQSMHLTTPSSVPYIVIQKRPLK